MLHPTNAPRLTLISLRPKTHARYYNAIHLLPVATTAMNYRRAMKTIAFMLLVLPRTLCAQEGTPRTQQSWELGFPSEETVKGKGVQLVTKFMELSVRAWAKKENTDRARWAMMSKEYVASQEIDTSDFTLNYLAWEDYVVEGTERNYVMVKVVNRTNAWSRRITFRLLLENGELVIEPSAVVRRAKDAGFPSTVTPWWTAGEIVND